MSSDGDGTVTRLADATEAEILIMARMDVERARSLTDDSSVSRAELRLALRYLARAVEDAAMVADLRAERLPDLADDEAAR
ncbi:hypothetical protein [Streptomyces lydicus]|uniref:hypothetical protein n=1 Tax=Streptomyces lydicus TaxID=47763 RepID=UPI0037B4E2E5